MRSINNRRKWHSPPRKCDPISATIGLAVIGGGLSYVNGQKNRKQQAAIQTANEASASQQAQRSEEQFNRLNQKQPGIAAMMASNMKGASKGIGSTFLTGNGGVPTGSLSLGGGSLLGG